MRVTEKPEIKPLSLADLKAAGAARRGARGLSFRSETLATHRGRPRHSNDAAMRSKEASAASSENPAGMPYIARLSRACHSMKLPICRCPHYADCHSIAPHTGGIPSKLRPHAAPPRARHTDKSFVISEIPRKLRTSHKRCEAWQFSERRQSSLVL
jgi:hypothetical protein